MLETNFTLEKDKLDKKFSTTCVFVRMGATNERPSVLIYHSKETKQNEMDMNAFQKTKKIMRGKML